MRLPKIQEDECPLKNNYFQSITAKQVKKYKTDKMIFDWQSAEVDLIVRIPDQQNLLQKLIQLQKYCSSSQIPHFYSFFFVNNLLAELSQTVNDGQVERSPYASELTQRKQKIMKKIQLQNEQIKNRKNKWFKIIQLIQLRQSLVTKINQQVINNQLQAVYSHIDDIRFINFQIIKKISQWSQQNLTDSDIRPFFLYEGRNYLVKMINDNTNVINTLNSKAVKFLSPPNPFYLSRDGNKTSMSQTQQLQIDNSMQILAKEKAQQLKMVLNPPKFGTQVKNQINELKNLKSKLEMDKAEQIKNIYKSTSNNFKRNTEDNQKYKFKQIKQQKINKIPQISMQKLKNKKKQYPDKQNLLQKIIQDKQIAVVQSLKNSQIKITPIKSNSKDKNTKPTTMANKYLAKIQLLRKSVEQNHSNKVIQLAKLQIANTNNEGASSRAQNLMRLSTISNKKLPKTVAEIKTPKPKIRLVMQKQSRIQDPPKNSQAIKNLDMYKSMQVRKTSTSFFKNTQKIQQKQQNIDIKPITQYARSFSVNNLTQNSFVKRSSPQKKMFQHKKLKSNLNNQKQNQRVKDKSKSRSHSGEQKSQLSFSKGPSKKKQQMAASKIQYTSQRDNKTQNSESRLRIINSKLRDLTIMSIYGKKNKLQSSPTVQNKYKQANSKAQIRKMQKDEIDQQLKAVKSRLQDISSKKIFDKKLSLANAHETKKYEREKEKEKEQQIRKQNIIKNEKLQQTVGQKNQLLKSIQQKDKRISQLMKLLQKQQIAQQSIQQKQDQQQKSLKLQKQQKRRGIQQLKQKISSQNKLIKQQMRQEEQKFIRLKQKQFKMKQQQIAKKYQSNILQMKQQYMKKNKQLQQKIIYEQRIRKQNQIRMLQEKRQMEQLRMQMEEKALKEQLLQEILKEQRNKQIEEEQKNKENQQARKQRVKKQILEKEEIERKILQNYEQDNRKLIQMFQQMKRNNQQTEKQNQRKMQQLKKMQQTAKQEQQNLRKLQQQLLKARLRLQMEQQYDSRKQNQRQVEGTVTRQQYIQDMQQLKLKVKQQILREMMSKRKQQEEEQKMEEEERAKKIAQIEEQIRMQLRRQEEEMEKIENQERQRYERLRKQMKQEHKLKMQQLQWQTNVVQNKQQNEQQQKQNKQENQHMRQQEQAQNEKIQADFKQQHKNQYQISKQDYQSELKKAIEASKQQYQNQQKERQNAEKLQKQKIDKLKQQQEQKIQQQKQKQRQSQQADKKKRQKQLQQKKQSYQARKILLSMNTSKQQQKPNKQPQKQDEKLQQNKQQIPQINKQTTIQQTKQIQTNKDIQEQANQLSILESPQKKKQINKIQQTKPIQSAQKNQTKNQQIQKQQQKKQPQTIKQPTDQILTKYQNLQQYLSKCKQIYIDDRAVPQFVTTFYGQLGPQVKEMMPYSQAEIQKNMINVQKKVDIFECPNGHSIGWMEDQRYILVGQMSCIQNIVRKYGQVQIQMTYIFNKTSPYQKQFLAKQVKIFDKVGFIFQKKLKQQNLYSIKLIIKIPIQILPKGFKTLGNDMKIKTGVVIQMVKKSQQTLQNIKYSFSYLLSQTLKHCLNNQEQLQFREEKSQQSKIIMQKMHLKCFNYSNFKSIQIDDKKMQVQVSLNLKYIQTHQYPCYVLKGGQYQCMSNSNGQKLFVAPVNKNLSVVVFNYDKSSEGFSLDILLNIKTRKINKQRQVFIYLPVWKKNQTIKLNKPGPKQFNYIHLIDANLSYGSIISTNSMKQQFKFIQAPFIFSLFQINDNGLLLRPLTGQIVQAKDLVILKK